MVKVYIISPVVRTDDTEAAAEACNRELMASGDSSSKEAAEAKISEFAPSLREWLAVEPLEVEIDDSEGI